MEIEAIKYILGRAKGTIICTNSTFLLLLLKTYYVLPLPKELAKLQ